MPSLVQLFLSIFVSFLITYLTIPLVIKISKLTKKFDPPGGRKIHKKRIPAFGGLAIFAGVSIGSIIWIPSFKFSDINYLYGGASLIMIFFIGFRDDLIPLRSYQKLFGQIIAAFILVYFGGSRLSSLHGFFGIHQLSEFWSYAVSIFTIVAIVNSFNLIDGIDGLAGSLGVIISGTFGTWFFLNGDILMFVLSFSILGSLLAFLKFNYTPSKIFLGDSGSLLLGFLFALLAMNFIEHNSLLSNESPIKIHSASIIAISILIIPLYDTLRVFVIRMAFLKSPFKSDKSHIHHLMLRIGLSHKETALVLCSVNLVFILIALVLHRIGSLPLLITIFTLCTLFLVAVDFALARTVPKKIKKKTLFK